MFNEEAQTGSQLFVRREPYIALLREQDIVIRDFRTEQKDISPAIMSSQTPAQTKTCDF